jgi:hypothetical protein
MQNQVPLEAADEEAAPRTIRPPDSTARAALSTTHATSLPLDTDMDVPVLTSDGVPLIDGDSSGFNTALTAGNTRGT